MSQDPDFSRSGTDWMKWNELFTDGEWRILAEESKYSYT